MSTCRRLATAPGLPSVRGFLLSRALVYLWSATLIRVMHSSLAITLLASALLLFFELFLFTNLPLFTDLFLFTRIPLFTDLFLVTSIFLISSLHLVSSLLVISELLLLADLQLFTDLFLFTNLLFFTDLFLLVWCTLERVLESEPWLPTGNCPIFGMVLLARLA